MEKISIIDTNAMALFCYPSLKIIHHAIYKFIYGEDFRNLLTKGVDTFLQYHCTKWLSDDYRSTALKQEDIEWGKQHWGERLLATKWKYWAIVLPENVLGKLNMRHIIEHYTGKGIKVETFPSAEAGLNWLIQLED